MTDLSQLAKSLTAAQREVLVEGRGLKSVFASLVHIGLCTISRPDRASYIADYTPLGLALRAHLKGQSDEG
jgi:hypothetical protein